MTRVPVHQAVGQFVNVEPGSTKGATVGVNLFYSDGTVVTEDDLGISSSTSGTASGTVWRLIREVPANLTEYAARGTSSAASGDITPAIGTTELVIRTALAAGININNPTGTTAEGQRLRIRLRDDGTGRALTWGSEFRSMSATLPATTTASKTVAMEFWRNEAETTWDLVTLAVQP